MALNYRDNMGKLINNDQWLIELSKSENQPKTTTIDYNGYDVDVVIKYVGTAGSLYKVYVLVSEDVAKYHGYAQTYQGKNSAKNDDARLIEAITAKADIFEKTEIDGYTALFFEPKYNAHIVNVMNKPEAFTYRVDKADGNTPEDKTAREVAKEKFDEITGA